MSYSYIKSVFPKFESGATFENVYTQQKRAVAKPATTPVAFDAQEYNQFSKHLMSVQNNVGERLPERPQERRQASVTVKESFESPLQGMDTCDGYMKHVLNCGGCKATMMKQFNIDADKARNEEFMELVSYIVFGIFILLLLDNVSKNK